ncbi:hypothetical protein [Sporosarcina sp. USHLN248]|uniref:hypothetical protein n=1 Tax=Sporosarcina sp. USHLN248 TaxID=3081300 RepID=UPI00301B0FF8
MKPEFSVTSGQMYFPKLKNTLKGTEFEAAKASVWLHMVNDMMRPVKWLKTTAKGTKVNWIPITSEKEYETAIDELEDHINQVNRDFGTEFKLNRSV